jgi:hypothetical protein
MKRLLLSGQSILRSARRPVNRRGKVRIAVTAPPTGRDEDAFFGSREIMKNFTRFLIRHNCPEWHGDVETFAFPAVSGAALSVLATLGFEDVFVPELEERVFLRIGDHINAAALTAVAAAGPAARNEFLAAKRDTPVAAISGTNGDFRFVDKHGEPRITRTNPRLRL